MLEHEFYPIFPNFLCIDRVGDINFFHDTGHLTQYDHTRKKMGSETDFLLSHGQTYKGRTFWLLAIYCERESGPA